MHATRERTRGLTREWSPRLRIAADFDPRRSTLIDRILHARGIGAGDAQSFLSPTLRQLHDPSLMPDLDRAAERILHAANSGEPIVIYGDYDVDGVSACAILWRVLRAVMPHVNVSCYVPHRIDEGYGLNSESIAELCNRGAKVIVSVDCGVTAVEPARVAKERGVDLIITDHHNTPREGEPLPEAFAIVHPRLPGSRYPFGDLCGAGVAFKLAWRIATLAGVGDRASEPARAALLDSLALASLGVVADVVPLRDENRVIAKFGLAGIKSSRIEGLRALVTASGLDGGSIAADDVGFKLGPRLNACGRLGHAREAVELLTTATGARARDIAESLSRLNEQRRAMERAIFDEACEAVTRLGMDSPARRAIVLAGEGWHPGIVGIVCSRLVEKFHRPAILLCAHAGHEGMLHGSGRSVDGVSLHEALNACAPHLTRFGGHDMAAGMSLRAEQLDAFRDSLIDVVNARLQPEGLVGRACYDAHADLGEVSPQAVRTLQTLAPFGRDNPEVVLRFDTLRVANHPRLMGSNGAHMSVQLASRNGYTVRAVAWRWGERVRDLSHGMTVDVLATPKVNSWNGNTKTDLVLVDVRVRT